MGCRAGNDQAQDPPRSPRHGQSPAPRRGCPVPRPFARGFGSSARRGWSTGEENPNLCHGQGAPRRAVPACRGTAPHHPKPHWLARVGEAKITGMENPAPLPCAAPGTAPVPPAQKPQGHDPVRLPQPLRSRTSPTQTPLGAGLLQGVLASWMPGWYWPISPSPVPPVGFLLSPSGVLPGTTRGCGEAGSPTARIRTLGGSAGAFDSFPGGPAPVFMSLINGGYGAGRNLAAAADPSAAARWFLPRCPASSRCWGWLSPGWAWPIPARANKDAAFPPLGSPRLPPCRSPLLTGARRRQIRGCNINQHSKKKKRWFKCSTIHCGVRPARPAQGHGAGACSKVRGHPAEPSTPPQF